MAAAVNETNANVDHLMVILNQGPAAGGGGGGAGGGVGGRPVPFSLSPGSAEDVPAIDYLKKRVSFLYNAGKEAMASEFDISHKKTVFFESEIESN